MLAFADDAIACNGRNGEAQEYFAHRAGGPTCTCAHTKAPLAFSKYLISKAFFKGQEEHWHADAAEETQAQVG